ncbi:glycosyltransferase family 4 protein [Aeromonas veronii]|uniref:glycosyltransferase family 4 protein n=1 Tax=Aeromonas veronii TaxID=654 RepID=UPI003D25FC6A
MKIWLVSTELKTGKGGISTSVFGYYEELLKNNIDVELVTSHSKSSKWILWLSSIIVMSKVKKDDFIWLHPGDWFSLLRKISIAIVGKLFGANVIFHYHDAMDDSLCKFHYKFLVRISLLIADHAIFLTPHGVDLIKKNNIPLNDTAIHVIPNPLDSNLVLNVRAGKLKPKMDESTTILCMSRLEPGKGVEQAILSAKFFQNNAKLLIAGDGSLLTELKILVEEQGLSEKVHFLGWVDYEEKVELLNSSHIFILPSDFDSFGMCFVEAMSAGLPVIALNRKATPYVIRDKYSGILSDTSEPYLLYNAIKNISSNYEYYSCNARQHVINNFMPDLIIRKFISVIRGDK